MEYVPCRSLFRSCFTCASDQLTRWVCLTDARASLFTRWLESILFTLLLNFAGTLCCCRSSTSSAFCDRHLTGSGFPYWRSIKLVSLIDSNQFQMQQIDWASTPFGLLGHLVRASCSSPIHSHLLLPWSTPIPFPFIFAWNGARFHLVGMEQERKCHRFYASYCMYMY